MAPSRSFPSAAMPATIPHCRALKLTRPPVPIWRWLSGRALTGRLGETAEQVHERQRWPTDGTSAAAGGRARPSWGRRESPQGHRRASPTHREAVQRHWEGSRSDRRSGRSQRADGRRLGGCDRQPVFDESAEGLRGCRSGTLFSPSPQPPACRARTAIEGGRTAPEYLGDHREAAARALGVEAPAICVVHVHELRVLATLAENSGRAGAFRLIAAGRLHAEHRKPPGGAQHPPNGPNLV